MMEKRIGSKFLGAKTERIVSRLSIVEKKLPQLPSKRQLLKTSHNLRQKQDILVFLREELNRLWTEHNVPAFHRSLFLEKLPKQDLLKSQEMLESDISQFISGKAPVLLVQKAIENRENLLEAIKDFIKSLDLSIARPVKKQLIDMIKSLRTASLEATESIKYWRSSLNVPNAPFLFHDKDYLSTMREDFAFIVHSLQDFIVFPKYMNTFFVSRKALRGGAFSVPFHMMARIKAAEQVISTSRLRVRSERKIIKKSTNPYKENLFPHHKKVTVYAEEDFFAAYEDVLNQVFNEMFPVLIAKSYDEMISASLVLFSSSILDKYLNEVILGLIPPIAQESLEELNNRECIELQQTIMDYALEQEAVEIAHAAALEMNLEAVGGELIEEIGFDWIISQAIIEEKALNELVVGLVYEDVVNWTLDEEWFELMVEEQAGEEELLKMWKLMSPSSQRQIWRSDPDKIRERITNMVYFDILNQIVGELWLSSLVQNLDSDELDVIMPIPDYEAKRKQMKNSIGLGLSLWNIL